MSETSKHTPGPWEHDRSYIRSDDGLRVAIVDDDGCGDAEMAANGDLMAAAPEMFAALEAWGEYDQLLRSLPGEGPVYGGEIAAVDAAYDACVRATAAALAKARGEG